MHVSPRIAILLAVVALTACGTTPTPMAEAKPVPLSRVLTKMATKSATPATLTVVRDSGLQGIEHVFELWVNGVKLAELRAGESHTTPVDPGATFIEIRMFNVLGSVAPVQVETVFDTSKTYVYRAGIDGQVKLHLRRDLSLSI
jgi:hypothetical protein